MFQITAVIRCLLTSRRRAGAQIAVATEFFQSIAKGAPKDATKLVDILEEKSVLQ